MEDRIYDKNYYKSHIKRLNYLEHLVEPIPGQIVLDIGCAGNMKVNKKQVIGLDPYKENNPDILADGRKIPFKSDKFDIVICSQVIEHVKEPLEIVNEAKRVTKQGGRVIVEVPNSLCGRNRVKVLIGRNIYWKWDDPRPVGYLHYREYVLSELLEVVRVAGLKIERVYTHNLDRGTSIPSLIWQKVSWLFPKTWRKYLGVVAIK